MLMYLPGPDRWWKGCESEACNDPKLPFCSLWKAWNTRPLAEGLGKTSRPHESTIVHIMGFESIPTFFIEV